MNILQVCAFAAPYEGNFMKSLYALDQRLAEMGHNTIYAFCEYASDKPWVHELQKRRKVFFLPQRYARIHPSTYFKLRIIIKDERVDIVHSHFELYDLPLGVILPKNCAMFWHLHDTIEDNYAKRSLLRKLLFKLHYKTFSKKAILCSVSEKHMRFVISLGFNEKKAFYIPNGTDLSRLRVNKKADKTFDFLIFAWDFSRKGGDIALAAAKRLYQEGYRFKIGFVGNDALWQKEEISPVLSQPWFVRQPFVEDISDLYNSAKCFLHISRAEGCSYAMLEATYFGLLLISSDIEENLFLSDLPNIFFVKTGSVEEAYSAMKNLLDINFKLNTDAVEKSRTVICEKYSLNAWVERIVDVYRDYGHLI